jgi:hypothetical protein
MVLNRREEGGEETAMEIMVAVWKCLWEVGGGYQA